MNLSCRLNVTILDRYIIKKFIGTFFVALLLIVVIVIIFDISEKIDDFVAKQAPLKEIVVDYYLYSFIPYFMNMFSPLFTFITVIFFTSKLAANSEIVAILAGGISFRRLMYPYFLSSLIIFAFSLTLNLFILPTSNKTKLAFENKYIHNQFANTNRNIHYQIAPGQYVYVESFSTANNTAYRFTLESIEDNEMVSRLTAETARWDSTKTAWCLKNYVLRDARSGVEVTQIGSKMDTVISLSVDDFYLRDDTVEALNRSELDQFIAMQQMRGDSMVNYSLMEKAKRLSMPFSTFILTLIGVSLSSKKKRGGIGLNLGVGIALSFSYILFMKFSEMFVVTDTLPPFIAIWLPNFLYAIISVFLYRMAPK